MGQQDYAPPSRDETHSARTSTHRYYAPPSRDEPNSARDSAYKSRQEYLPPSRDNPTPARNLSHRPPRLVSQEYPPPVRDVDDLNSARNSVYKSRHVSYDYPPPSRDYDDLNPARNSTYKARHVSHDYPPPSRDFEDLNSARNSAHQSRHISIQSRVDSLAADSMWDDRSKRDTGPDIPAIYNHNGLRSTSFLMDQSTMQNSGPEWMSEKHSVSGPPRDPTPPPDMGLNISTLHEVLFVGVVVVAQLMALAGLGQAIAPMKIIAAGLDVDNPGEEAWFAASYSLTVGTFILISGRMGDILGHKRMLIFGYFFLGVWSGFAGFSAYVADHIFFDICRGFQGVGAALIVPNALALLGRAYPPGIKKNIVFSLFGAMAPWGFVIGAIFASVFSQLTWWPWTFWSYAFACWGLSIFSVIAVPKSLAHDAQFAGRTDRPGMDWTGSTLGVSGLVLVNVAWNNAPLFGWGTPHVYFLLIIGLLCLVAFVWVEARAVSPLIPVSVLTKPVVYTMALVGIGWGSFGIWIHFCWRFLLEVRGQTPLLISAEFVPAMICGLLAAGVTGFMLTHTPVSFTIMVSMLAFFIGELVAAFQPAHQTYWAQMFVSILIMRKFDLFPTLLAHHRILTSFSQHSAWTCPSPPPPSFYPTPCPKNIKVLPLHSSTPWSTTPSLSG
jgi:MFS family permease